MFTDLTTGMVMQSFLSVMRFLGLGFGEISEVWSLEGTVKKSSLDFFCQPNSFRNGWDMVPLELLLFAVLETVVSEVPGREFSPGRPGMEAGSRNFDGKVFDGFLVGGGPIQLERQVHILLQRRQCFKVENPFRSRVPPGPCLANLVMACTRTIADLLSSSTTSCCPSPLTLMSVLGKTDFCPLSSPATAASNTF